MMIGGDEEMKEGDEEINVEELGSEWEVESEEEIKEEMD